ncbi:MAG TPA: thioredoxin domain-containing protein [Bryobacteraceae bacterium]|nr:thioredoxin domain-containing protein [Bryobacteraceae bacterium]
MKLTAAALLAAALLLAAAVPSLAAPPPDKGKIMGSTSAPVTIEIFADFECPMCKRFHEEELPLLVRDFVNSGKVCIVAREFPLKIAEHKYSRQAANFATAAARIGEYDAVANVLFHTQESWGETGKVWETVASVLKPDQQKKVQALAGDPSVLAEVEADYNYAVASGINATPTLILTRGNKRFPASGGVLEYSLLKQMINDLLK